MKCYRTDTAPASDRQATPTSANHGQVALVSDMMTPMAEGSYVRMNRAGKLSGRVLKAIARLAECRLCPRECSVDRSKTRGVCGTGQLARVASYGPHFGEERPLVGSGGSGTIFFSGCSLLCSFCQNYDISHHGLGTETSTTDLAGMMLDLQARGCHNINLVTPSHVVPQILQALLVAADEGLHLPVVYNSSGYDSLEALALLEGVIDIYMPDFKFWTDDEEHAYLPGVMNYGEVARAAITEMHRQVGDLQIDHGLAVRGLLIRHLVMPQGVANTKEILAFLATISPLTYVNVMNQYRPCFDAKDDGRIGTPTTAGEYQQALEWAREAGLRRLDG